MCGSLRWKADFCEEVDKFIEAAQKHTMTLTQNKDSIIYPCHDCKNHIVWRDVGIIRSHLIM
jgi:RNase P subunit RPR2